MKLNKLTGSSWQKWSWLLLGLILLAGIAAVILIVFVGSSSNQPTSKRQVEVARRGANIMPFDLEKTTHIFQSSPDGGVEIILANDPGDNQQIYLVQQHLRDEAQKFTQADFSDPVAIHGATMPGLSTLQNGAKQIKFDYSALPSGAQIRYTTNDPALIQALHDWFTAQSSDHGQHKM